MSSGVDWRTGQLRNVPRSQSLRASKSQSLKVSTFQVIYSIADFNHYVMAASAMLIFHSCIFDRFGSQLQPKPVHLDIASYPPHCPKCFWAAMWTLQLSSAVDGRPRPCSHFLVSQRPTMEPPPASPNPVSPNWAYHTPERDDCQAESDESVGQAQQKAPPPEGRERQTYRSLSPGSVGTIPEPA